MKNAAKPFFVAGFCVGSVRDITAHAGFNRGKLSLENENSAQSQAINAIVALAKQVDDVPAENYLAAWNAWRKGCDEIQGRDIWIGTDTRPIEEFSILSDWSIEWRSIPPDEFL
jgi:hypothetical protein